MLQGPVAFSLPFFSTEKSARCLLPVLLPLPKRRPRFYFSASSFSRSCVSTCKQARERRSGARVRVKQRAQVHGPRHSARLPVPRRPPGRAEEERENKRRNAAAAAAVESARRAWLGSWATVFCPSESLATSQSTADLSRGLLCFAFVTIGPNERRTSRPKNEHRVIPCTVTVCPFSSFAFVPVKRRPTASAASR